MLLTKFYVCLHIHCIILYTFSNFILFLLANPVEIMLATYMFSYFYIASGTLVLTKNQQFAGDITHRIKVCRQTACPLPHDNIFVQFALFFIQKNRLVEWAHEGAKAEN